MRVRFPPSPTGPVHIGNIRTAIYNWLYARRHGGTFVFRIEDTDRERSKKEYEEQIIEGLQWLGLDWDEGIGKEAPGMHYRQTERTAAYSEHLNRLLADKKAYWCYCSKEELEAQKQIQIAEGRPQVYEGHCRKFINEPPADGRRQQVIRLLVDGGIVEFRDEIRGTVKTEASLLGDFVIAKSLAEPLYNLAVVVDDEDMKITHVIRGEDHISNTPKQILIQRALGFSEPHYAHLPLILGADRSKLSKRNADVSLLSYRDRGFLPEAVVNFLVLLGWHPAGDNEVFTLQDIIPEFDLSRVQKGGAIFNEEKLLWLNREHLKRIPTERLAELLRPGLEQFSGDHPQEFIHAIIDAVRDRMRTMKDFSELAGFFFELPDYEPKLLIWNKDDPGETGKVLEETLIAIQEANFMSPEALTVALQPLLDKYGKGNVLWPMRAALSGRTASPDPYRLAAIFGKEESLRRIRLATEKSATL